MSNIRVFLLHAIDGLMNNEFISYQINKTLSDQTDLSLKKSIYLTNAFLCDGH